MHRLSATVAAFVLAATPAVASAQSVDFNEFTNSFQSAGDVPSSFTSGGFTFSNLLGTLGVWTSQPQANNGGGRIWNGNPYLLFANVGSIPSSFKVARTDGAPFQLLSFQLAVGWYGDQGTSTADVTFFWTGGGSSTQTLNIADDSWATIASGGFIDAFEVASNRDGYEYVSLDNINTTAVPEPSTYALMATGLGLVLVAARRRRNA